VLQAAYQRIQHSCLLQTLVTCYFAVRPAKPAKPARPGKPAKAAVPAEPAPPADLPPAPDYTDEQRREISLENGTNANINLDHDERPRRFIPVRSVLHESLSPAWRPSLSVCNDAMHTLTGVIKDLFDLLNTMSRAMKVKMLEWEKKANRRRARGSVL